METEPSSGYIAQLREKKIIYLRRVAGYTLVRSPVYTCRENCKR